MASGPQPDKELAGGLDRTSDLQPGALIGRYRLLTVLQRGGMGEIFLAEPVDRPGEQVVIKRLLEDFVAEEAYLKMFRDEARIMSQLRHPNIVQVLETPVLREHLCMVMELVPGRSVAQILQENRSQALRMPPNVVVHVMIEVLRGLHHAHTAVGDDGQPLDLVHRDVSPGNLLISFDGRVKVTDFGIAKSKLSVLATSVGVVKGTTRYLSPEQIRGADVTPRADLFACAAVMVEMLTGQALFDRGQVPPTLLAIVKGHRPPVGDLLPFRAPELSALLEQALALSPVHRPESAQAMADALDALRPTLGPSIGPSDLGAYLGRLFPDRSAAADPGAAGRFGATYLLEAQDAETSSAGGSEVHRSMSGAKPLDATEFEARAAPPATPLAEDLAFPSGLLLESSTGDVEAVATDPAEAGGGIDFVQAVEAAARELEAPRAAAPDPAESEPGVSDSAVEADAFALTAQTARPRGFSVSSFAAGVLVGGAAVGAALWFGFIEARGARDTSSAARPPIVVDPVPLGPDEPPPPPPPPPVPEPVAAATVAEARSSTPAEPAPAAAARAEQVGYITVTRPRRAKVLVNGRRVPDRVPIRRYEVPAGRLKIVIKRRRLEREVDVSIQPGQHLDVSRPEIRVLEEGVGAGDAAE